jgi:glycosyltransferase involved in cell wall biosynthesis
VSVLIGHPTGNPNSFNAALAHFEAGRLAAFCIPLLLPTWVAESIEALPIPIEHFKRIARRSFPPLTGAPLAQATISDWMQTGWRLISSRDNEQAWLGNHWVMHRMSSLVNAQGVTAVHCYEDCALEQFHCAKRHNKLCIYDLPIGYWAEWANKSKLLIHKYGDWLPSTLSMDAHGASLAQKTAEIKLADLVLVPSEFVANTVQNYLDKQVTTVPYGVDTIFWSPRGQPSPHTRLRFIFVGQVSVRKGTPLLIKAWELANLENCELHLVGKWQLSRALRLPDNVVWHAPCSKFALRSLLRSSDVFVLPTNFEGLSLSLLEALACGLPVLTTAASGGAGIVSAEVGLIIPEDDLAALVDSLRWFEYNNERIRTMSAAARKAAELTTWESYRAGLSRATSRLLRQAR